MTKRDDIRAWLERRDFATRVVYASLKHKIQEIGFDSVYIEFEDPRSKYWEVGNCKDDAYVTPTSECFVSTDMLVKLHSEAYHAMTNLIAVLDDMPCDIGTVLHCIRLDESEGR